MHTTHRLIAHTLAFAKFRREAIFLRSSLHCREALDAKTGECAELEAARAEVARELAEAQSSVAELAAGKQALESSLAATKASLLACEDKRVSAEVCTCPHMPDVMWGPD